MKIDTKTMTLPDYLGKVFDCDCGRRHYTRLEAAEIKSEAVQMLPDYLEKFEYHSIYVVCDAITYEIAGKEIIEMLKKADFSVGEHIFRRKALIPDEEALGEMMITLDPQYEVMVAVGTGSINDLVRFLSYRTGRPFITVATAPPMDGFASSVAALMTGNFKTTYETHSPKLIIGDTSILKNAPFSMITAGLGDILGKFTCLCDWKLSNIINKEYYCPVMTGMVDSCIQKVYQNAGAVKERDEAVIGQIMEALVLTGVAMSFAGNSRPAAGCEHHLSHYWEMLFIQQKLPPVLHGTKVGIGTVIILKIAQLLRETSVDFEAARQHAVAYRHETWEKEIREVYHEASDGIIQLEEEARKNSPERVLKRIDAAETHWEEIRSLLKELPDPESIKALLGHLEAPFYPSQKGITDKMLWDGIVYGKETRNRYTLLQLVWDLGMAEEIADKVVEYVNET
jgi:glycerol-1-phosphate dehydrogenase [NAD(P)+]